MRDQKEGAILLKHINPTNKTLKKHIAHSHKQYKFDQYKKILTLAAAQA